MITELRQALSKAATKYGQLTGEFIAMRQRGRCASERGKGRMSNGIRETQRAIVLERKCYELTAKLEAAEKACAEKDKALNSALAGVWDGHYSGKGVEVAYAQAVDKEVKHALSTDCGKDHVHISEAVKWSDRAVTVQAENARLRGALRKILNFPVHSEPVGGAMAMQDIAHDALGKDV